MLRMRRNAGHESSNCNVFVTKNVLLVIFLYSGASAENASIVTVDERAGQFSAKISEKLLLSNNGSIAVGKFSHGEGIFMLI